MEPAPTSRWTWLALLALTLAALGLRLWGIGYGVPVWEEPDPDIVGHVDQLRGDPVLARVTAPEQQYPHLIARLASLAPPRPPASGEGAPEGLHGNLRAAAWTHVQVRTLVAALASLIVPLTFLIARRFVSAGWALFAAALVATSLLHQHFSQQARPHGAAATFFAWALLANLRLAQRGGWREFAHAGLASALTLATLQSGVAVLLAGLAATWISVARGRARWVQIALPIGLVAAALPLFYPYYFDGSADVQDPARVVDDEALRSGEHAVALEEFDGRGFAVLAKSLWNYDPLLSVLALAALSFALVRWRPRAASDASRVLLAFGAPYVLVCGLYGMTYERFALPLLPLLAVLVAWSVQHALRTLASVSLRRALTTLLAAALLFPAAVAAMLAWLRSQPDTLDRAAQWYIESGARETLWVAPPLDLPLVREPRGLELRGRTPRELEGFTPWTAWQTLMPPPDEQLRRYDIRWLMPKLAQRADPGAHLDQLGACLVLVERFVERQDHAAMAALRRALEARGECVASFSPDPGPQASELELFFQLSDHFNSDAHLLHPHFALRLLRARAIGRVLEVWRLPAGVSDSR